LENPGAHGSGEDFLKNCACTSRRVGRRVLHLFVYGRGYDRILNVATGVSFDYRRSDAPREGFQFRLVPRPMYV
jgi:hypothetical protein